MVGQIQLLVSLFMIYCGMVDGNRNDQFIYNLDCSAQHTFCLFFHLSYDLPLRNLILLTCLYCIVCMVGPRLFPSSRRGLHQCSAPPHSHGPRCRRGPDQAPHHQMSLPSCFVLRPMGAGEQLVTAVLILLYTFQFNRLKETI